jgi:hypothetical protein
MKVYAIYNQENKFIAAFPDRKDAMNYGIVMFGKECGWEYTIKEMCLVEQLLTSIPYSQLCIQPIVVPYTKPIPLETTPYEPNIWTCNDGPKATYDSGPFAPGTK